MNAEDHTFYIDQISYTDRFGNPTNQFAPGCTGTFDLIIDQQIQKFRLHIN